MRRLLLALGLLAIAQPAAAAGITVINQTGRPILKMDVRPFKGRDWSGVDGAMSPGARRTVETPDTGCAFDIRAELAGGAVVSWLGVNFCEVKSVALNRRPDGTTWVDYD